MNKLNSMNKSMLPICFIFWSYLAVGCDASLTDRQIADAYFKTVYSLILEDKRDDALSMMYKDVKRSAYFYMSDQERAESFTQLRQQIVDFLKQPYSLYVAENERNGVKEFIYQFRREHVSGMEFMESTVLIDPQTRTPSFGMLAGITKATGVEVSLGDGEAGGSVRILSTHREWTKIDFNAACR